MGGRAAHGEEGEPGQFINLSPHQVEHVGPDGLHFAAMPELHWVSGQGIVVLVVPGDEGHGEGQALQPVQGLVIPFIPEPHATKVSQLEYHVLLGELPVLREIFRTEPRKISMGVARCEDLHAVMHLLLG